MVRSSGGREVVIEAQSPPTASIIPVKTGIHLLFIPAIWIVEDVDS